MERFVSLLKMRSEESEFKQFMFFQRNNEWIQS